MLLIRAKAAGPVPGIGSPRLREHNSPTAGEGSRPGRERMTAIGVVEEEAGDDVARASR